jgi:hypothetical protein
MGRQVAVVLYVVAMAAIIVSVDFGVLATPILGTADSEYRHRLSVRSLLLDIPQASVIVADAMSALPPKADIAEGVWQVRFVPKADIARLFDHLIGTSE